MSFANEWLMHLKENGKIIYYIKLIGELPEDILDTQISINENKVEQIHYNPESVIETLGTIPDKIEIPIEVKSVKIEINGGFLFTINKDRTMKVRYADYIGRGLNPEIEKNIYKEACNHRYKIVEFMQSDV